MRSSKNVTKQTGLYIDIKLTVAFALRKRYFTDDISLYPHALAFRGAATKRVVRDGFHTLATSMSLPIDAATTCLINSLVVRQTDPSDDTRCPEIV